ncbi:Os04g0633950 [Oryza sativa Japonica Group]|uniref:Os04g0633950 protein n=1 Tax=Oryza sativa subsp. japonica TaxID=39947 RepID=A0A0P0WF85_ORYSJ|nr:hypothetical protein EE612_025766 [Oryza sativa]BAS91198.1 Os04g0633950 [Oryza sativa Japonica Group]
MRVGELHAAHRQEAVRGAAQRRVSPAPGGGVPHLLPRRRRRRGEALHAAAERRRRRAGVAQAERPALAVVVAQVPRPLEEVLPCPAARLPHQPLDLADARHHEAGERRAGVGGVAEGDLAGAHRQLVAEHVGVRPHLRDAAEPQPVPRPRPVHLAVAVPEHVLRHALRVRPVPVVPRRRVAGRTPRREVPLGAGPQVLADLHAGEQRVTRVVERLPHDDSARAAIAAVTDDEVSRLEQLRRHGRAAPGRRVRRPHDVARAIEQEEAPRVGDHQHAGGVRERAVAVGDPADDVVGDGEPYPEVSPAGARRRRRRRREEAQRE